MERNPHVQPNVDSYNAVIKAFVKSEEMRQESYKKAQQMIDRMIELESKDVKGKKQQSIDRINPFRTRNVWGICRRYMCWLCHFLS